MTDRQSLATGSMALGALPRVLGVFVSVLAISVLAGWVFDVPALRSALPFGAAMRANAAVGLLLCGVALVALTVPQRRLGWLVASVAGVLVILLAAATLLQDVASVDLGIDQWLIVDNARTVRTVIPGRMSPPSSFCLVLIGIALVLAAKPAPSRYGPTVINALAVVVIVVGGIAIVARATESTFDFRFLSYTRIASYSAVALVLIGVALLALSRSREREPWSLDKVTTASFAIGALAMIAMAGISYQFTSKMRAEVVRVIDVQGVLKDMSETTAALADFTISAGRYIITRDERSLDTRSATKAEVVDTLARLRDRVRGVPRHLERLDEIERLHARRVAMSDEIIDRVRAQTATGAAPAVAAGSPLGQEYPALGVEIERLLEVMAGDAYTVLAREEAQAAETSRKTFLLLPLSLFVAMTILALAVFHLNTNAAARARADARLAVKRERLNVLHEIDRAIAGGKTPVQIAQATLPRLRDLLGVPRVSVHVGDANKSEADWLVAVGRRRVHTEEDFHYPVELVGDLAALQRGETQVIEVESIRSPAERQALLASGIRWYTVVPMRVGTEFIGGLSFGGTSRTFSDDQQEMATEVAAQIAIAIAQARLGERARQADARYRLMFETVPVGVVMTRLDGTIVSLNPAFARSMGHESPAEAEARLQHHIQNAYVDHADRDEYVARLQRSGVVSNFETRYLRADGSQMWVSLSGRSVHGAHGDETQFASMVDDITLRKDQELRIARLSRVKEMQSSVNSAVVRIRDRQLLIEELCRIAVNKGGLRAAWVAWHDRQAQMLRPIASAGHLDGFLDLISHSTAEPPQAQVGFTLRTFRGGVSLATSDTRTESGIVYREAALARGFLSAMHLPLTIGGAVEGVLVLFADVPHYFDEEERRLLDELAADVSFALESLHNSARLDYLAYYDPLSGLPNRTLFQDRLAQTIHSRDGEQKLVAVALLDIERFRRVNESHGRHAGDSLLRDISARLLKANETAARLGLDMFGVILTGARNIGELNRSVEALLAQCFADPFEVGGEQLRIACRTALSVFPDDGADAEVLLHNAEAALKLSKAHDDRIVYYAPEMNARVAEALAIESKLRRAVERREFVLHYQPKVSLATESVVGLEALIRWQDPESGLIPPMKFIPVLEETGMIVEVGRWAVEQTFRDMQAWAAQGLSVPRVAVNVSAIQLQRKDFVAVMVEEIRRGGDNPEWLELEITEGLVMRNVKESTGKLSILRGMGVTVAIDDFGTGYSSLSYLSRLPVDSLKIDRSFVSGLPGSAEAEAIASTIIALAHSLKLQVVAEGVETRGQADMLHALGCDQAQGYLFSRPVPAIQIETLLRTGMPPAKAA